MAKRKKIRPVEGQLVAITLSNKTYGLAQVVKTKEDENNYVVHTTWAFFNIHVKSLDELLPINDLSSQISNPVFVCGMDYEELEKGLWPVIGQTMPQFNNIQITEDLIEKWQREEIAGAYLLEMFLGIVPWDSYKDPEYLDKRLLPGYGRPKDILLK